jgi:hypothetical protein
MVLPKLASDLEIQGLPALVLIDPVYLVLEVSPNLSSE